MWNFLLTTFITDLISLLILLWDSLYKNYNAVSTFMSLLLLSLPTPKFVMDSIETALI